MAVAKVTAASFVACALLVGLLGQLALSCNEQVCASIVSKCMLTQSCKCDLKDCTCCKECYNCLNYLYGECCSCVDMCPKPNETQQARHMTSLPDKLEGFPALFDALTLEEDEEERWVSFTFPVDIPEVLYEKDPSSFHVIDSPDQRLDDLLGQEALRKKAQGGVVTVNCTVAYISQCLSLGKCRTQCLDMGASSMRWVLFLLDILNVGHFSHLPMPFADGSRTGAASAWATRATTSG